MSVLAELHLQRIARLPCVACLVIRRINHPMEEIHHLESDRHAFSDFIVLPLCWEMHQGPIGIHGRHRLGFEKLHGITQIQLLGVVTSMLLADRQSLVGG